MAISKDLLELLVCPVCRGRIAPTADNNGLHCAACHLVFPIRDNLPVMIKDEARPDSQTQPSAESR